MISDIIGVSGRRIIAAMIAGIRNPHKLAALADRRIKASPKMLYDALHAGQTKPAAAWVGKGGRARTLRDAM